MAWTRIPRQWRAEGGHDPHASTLRYRADREHERHVYKLVYVVDEDRAFPFRGQLKGDARREHGPRVGGDRSLAGLRTSRAQHDQVFAGLANLARQ